LIGERREKGGRVAPFIMAARRSCQRRELHQVLHGRGLRLDAVQDTVNGAERQLTRRCNRL